MSTKSLEITLAVLTLISRLRSFGSSSTSAAQLRQTRTNTSGVDVTYFAREDGGEAWPLEISSDIGKLGYSFSAELNIY